MKKVFLLLLALTLMAGCKKDEPYGEGFTYSDCTKSESELIDLSLLTLQYEEGDLRVTRADAWMNCSFQSRGLVCSVSVKGNEIGRAHV